MNDLAWRRRSMFRHLLWKDLRLVRSLIYAALIAPAVLLVVLAAVRLIWRVQDLEIDSIVGFLFFLPFFVSLGAAPMLIGTENEERTFDWLRRLPVSWWRVFLSKAVAGVVVLLLTIIWTGLLLVLYDWVFDRKLLSLVGGSPFQKTAEFVAMSTFLGNLAVMAIGFLTALLIRNPLASAMTVIPLLISGFVWMSFYDPNDGLYFWGPIGLFGCSLLVTLWLAHRRFHGPSDQRWQWFDGGLAPAPIVMPIRSTNRPSPTRALIWQHARQNQFILIGITVIAIASLLPMITSPTSDPIISQLLPSSAYIVIPLAQLALGVIAFHGDHRPPRRHFFSDRGLPPTLVWWTRMLVPSIVSLSIMLSWAMVFAVWNPSNSQANLEVWMLPWFFGLLFLFGASTGQWFRRGALAFFVAPVVAYFSIIAMMLATLPMHDYISWEGVAAIVWVSMVFLLASTWHINRLWLRGREDAELIVPAILWIAFPIALVAIVSALVAIVSIIVRGIIELA